MTEFEEYRIRVNSCLRRFLSLCNTSTTLQSAMEYGVFNGGKRIRPVLVYATTEAFGGNLDFSDAAASAVELVHSYSLIHDDLPAMDDDAMRRGKPSTHIQFDEATAILAGDALLSLAFEVLASDPNATHQKIIELARASGANGMVGGQMIDIEAVATTPSHNALEQMHQMKTGALIRASILLGAYDYKPSPKQLRSLQQFAHDIGLAFQVRDDLLDALGDESHTGKASGADQKKNKPTYVSLHGIRGAQDILSRLGEQAITALTEFDTRADTLREVARFVVARAS